MKYIISESRLDETITNYLDGLFNVDNIYSTYPYEYDDETGEEGDDETRIEFYIGDYENDDTCYKVSNQVELWQNFIQDYTPIKPDAERLIYALSKHISNNLDAETVTLIASFVKNNMNEIEYYSSPTFEALDIYGSVNQAEADAYKGFESDEDEDEADYGGGNKKIIKSRKYKKLRKNKTKKSKRA
jgi:hypothetical protein